MGLRSFPIFATTLYYDGQDDAIIPNKTRGEGIKLAGTLKKYGNGQEQ